MEIKLHNKKFRALTNSDNGEVSDDTLFHYYQEENVIWAEYGGGDIEKGFLVGKKVGQRLEFNYQHINKAHELMTGKCVTRIEINKENKIQLHENWEWTCKDFSRGSSLLKEV